MTTERVSSATVETHYYTLGVEPAATAPQIRAAFRELILKHHPDRALAAQEQAQAVNAVVGNGTSTVQALNEAWEVLGDAGRREQYDRDLASQRGEPVFELGRC